MYLRQALQAQAQLVPSQLRAMPRSLKRAWQVLALSERLWQPLVRMLVLLAFQALARLTQLRPVYRLVQRLRVSRVRAQLALSWQRASRSMGSVVMQPRFLLVKKRLRAMRTFTQQAWQALGRLTLLGLLPSQALAVWDRLRRRLRRQLYLRGLLPQAQSLNSSFGDE